MNAITVNSFPSFHSFTSPRSWFLAIIVLLHVGFFLVLSNGLSRSFVFDPPKASVVDMIPLPKEPPQPAKPLAQKFDLTKPFVPVRTDMPKVEYDEQSTAPRDTSQGEGPLISEPVNTKPEPIVVPPQVDPGNPLAQPDYPSAAIRANQTGTVVLAVQVLADGRIGAVRIEQSSGHRLLDEAAVRAAKGWRMTPGSQDGAPLAMWKQVPVTFKLTDSVRF